MAITGTRISDVSYDTAKRAYTGAVTLFGPDGIRQVRVSAPGQPGWGYERTLEALSHAGQTAIRDAGHAPL